MMERLTDAELVEAYRSTGGSRHFEILVQRHREKLLRLVLSVLGHGLQGDAEDVVQLVFLRVHDRLATFHGRSRFGTWIHRIAHRLAIDYKRTRQRRARLLPEGPMSREPSSPNGLERAMDRERGELIRRALLEVSDPYQTALRLHYWLGLSVAEIAETLDVAVGTAKSYLHRGRQRLHRVLQRKEIWP